MAKKKKEPKVEKVFKDKKDKKTEGQAEEVVSKDGKAVSEETISEEEAKASGNAIDDFLGVEASEEETPEEEKLTETQKNKLEKLNTLKSKISKILQSSNVEIVDENFDDEYESSDAPGAISQEDYDSLKSMYGGKDKNGKPELTLTIDDFDYTYVGQYLEEYDLMHMKNIKRVKIQRKHSPKLKKFLIAATLIVVIALGSVLAFMFTRKPPVILTSVVLNQTTRTYYTDQDFDPTGLYFIAEYSDGKIERIKLDDKSHFNSLLSSGTGKYNRVGEEEKKIKFISNGTLTLVFTYQGFNVNYEVTIKKKNETGLKVIYSPGIFEIPENGYISEKLLRSFINYEDIGYTYNPYTPETNILVYVDGQKCSQTANGYSVPSGTNPSSLIVVRFSTYELILDSSKDMLQV